ncbi:winged helix-turn-helix domain-containing protein [Halocatena halophila]|uniref:winged helix-turn-helix domain-containing protein n=1 Tax=Halocatena halophila TaxID=2814576 RepID=UPI002ED3E443
MATEQRPDGETDWDKVSFVIRSEYRLKILDRLEDRPAIPSTISEDTEIQRTHVSRALSELREKEIIDLLVPDERKKGRIYGLTEQGSEIFQEADEMV